MPNEFQFNQKAEDFYFEYIEDAEDMPEQPEFKPSNLKELPFEETKAMLNNQAKQLKYQSIFMLTEHLNVTSTAAVSTDRLSQNRRKTVASPTTSLFAAQTSQKRQQPVTEKDLFRNLANESAAQYDATMRKEIREKLCLIKNTLFSLKQFIVIESSYPSSDAFFSEHVKKQQKELVDYILLYLAGISNKNSAAYKKLSQINYLTLLECAVRFIEKSRINQFTDMQSIQRTFIQYLYYRVFNEKKVHYSIIQNINQATEVSEHAESKATAAPEPIITTAPNPPESILDRILNILCAILNKLMQCFSCQRPEQENTHETAAPVRSLSR